MDERNNQWNCVHVLHEDFLGLLSAQPAALGARVFGSTALPPTYYLYTRYELDGMGLGPRGCKVAGDAAL